MKWNKLGKIFDPLDFQWHENFIGFAQSPQTLVFDDFVRIYFSIRKADTNGKFLSHIQYVDFNKSFTKVINKSNHEVIALGKLGCFDEHGIFPINVVKHQHKILAYTNGWTRRKSVSVDTGIGYAYSDDNGETFKKIGDGPIMGPSTYEPVLVGDAFVKVFDNTFHMWYLFGLGWKINTDSPIPERTYKIAHATSKDGINWDKEEGIRIISDKLGEDECQALPTVLFFNGKYHMFFCYRSSVDFRKNPKNSYKIGYAFSEDLKSWTRNDDLAGIITSASGWDSEMQCYPHVFEVDNKIYLLYNGNEFGKHGFGLAVLNE
jgi:sucrose-6-phosphate hydrolase SacC (GH32 family)